jgi:hypothetical protein
MMHFLVSFACLLLAATSFCIFTYAYVPYCAKIRRRQVPEAKVSTWAIWAVVNWIAVVGMFKTHSVTPTVVVATFWCTTVTVLLLVTRQGKIAFEPAEYACMLIAGVSLLAWKLTSNPTLGASLALFANLVGSFPTVQSVWRNPDNEPRKPWALMFLATGLQILSLMLDPTASNLSFAQSFV